jgi:hypothetical protein
MSKYLGREVVDTKMMYWEDDEVRIDLQLKDPEAWADDCNDKATHAYMVLNKTELENLINKLTNLYNENYK